MEKKMKDIARHDKDTGSSEVQISQLTDKIENLSQHITTLLLHLQKN